MTSDPLLSAKAVELIQKADQAFDSRNFQYASVLYESVLNLHPEYHPARNKLHLCQIRLEEAGGLLARVLHVITVLPARLAAGWAMQRQDWSRALAYWEKCLKAHPLDASLHRADAQCLERMGWTEAAIQEYGIARMLQPRDIPCLRKLARLHAQENRWEEARKANEEIIKINPDDPQAPAELRKIAAMHTMEKGAWRDTEGYRKKIRDEKQAQSLEQQQRLVQTPADIQQRISEVLAQRKEKPRDIGLLRELSQLYRRQGNMLEAQSSLEEALRIAPDDYFLLRDAQEMKLEKMTAQIAAARAQAQAHPEDPGKSKALEGLLRQQRAMLLVEKQREVAQYPTNLLLRFELGQLYLQAGQADEAAAEFQQAVKNPSKKLESQKFLGICFKRKGLHELAADQLCKAAEGIAEMSALKKDILYELAGAYEAMGKMPEALREYEKIYAVDIAFKDVAKKIERRG